MYIQYLNNRTFLVCFLVRLGLGLPVSVTAHLMADPPPPRARIAPTHNKTLKQSRTPSYVVKCNSPCSSPM